MWAEYYIGVEYTFEQLEMSDVMQLVCILFNTNHSRAQRCQHTSLENTLSIGSTVTSGFEQSGCPIAMSRPAIFPSYERLRDKSFTSNIEALYAGPT